MFSRRFIREKVLQALYAYAQLRGASLFLLGEYVERKQKDTVASNYDIIRTLRAALWQEHILDQSVYSKIQALHSSPLFLDALEDYTQHANHDYKQALALYQREVQQPLSDYYVIWSIFLKLYEQSLRNKGLLAHSMTLRNIYTSQSLVPQLKARQLNVVPKEIVFAIYKKWKDTPLDVSGKWSHTQDCTLLLRLCRAKCLQEASFRDYMYTVDRNWSLHRSLVWSLLIKTIKNYAQDSTKLPNLVGLDLSQGEIDFGLNLCKEAIAQYPYEEVRIAQQAEHWSMQRLNLTDKVIIVLALTEIRMLNHVPFQVSMNEYLEIAKRYSTPKSAVFINGILENILLNSSKHT